LDSRDGDDDPFPLCSECSIVRTNQAMLHKQ
jgi:hypothetical protein